MRTILARNAHQALAESCFQLDSFGATNSDGGKTLPIPTNTTILMPLERVQLYGVMFPLPALITACSDLADERLRNVSHGAKALEKDSSVQVTLHPSDPCDDIGVAYVRVDMDGKVQMMACCPRTNVIEEASDIVYLSMVMEYVATVCKREVGALWITSMSPQCSSAQLDVVKELAKYAPQPPNQFDDPYSLGVIKNTIPLMSIPSGRWDRELKQFFSNETFDAVDYVDPFIQNVLAPAHRAHKLLVEQAPIAQVQRAIGEIASQDWMQACLLSTQQDQPCTPQTE